MRFQICISIWIREDDHAFTTRSRCTNWFFHKLILPGELSVTRLQFCLVVSRFICSFRSFVMLLKHTQTISLCCIDAWKCDKCYKIKKYFHCANIQWTILQWLSGKYFIFIRSIFVLRQFSIMTGRNGDGLISINQSVLITKVDTPFITKIVSKISRLEIIIAII